MCKVALIISTVRFPFLLYTVRKKSNKGAVTNTTKNQPIFCPNIKKTHTRFKIVCAFSFTIENPFSHGIGKKIVGLEERAECTNEDLQTALANKGKPIEHAEELAQKSARLEQLNRELEVGRADEVIMNDSEDEEKDTESHGSHEQDNPDNNTPIPPKHKR